MFFLRKSNLERLPVAMSGVRMGERVLQIGCADPSLVGAIAAKVGLSGHASIAVATDRHAEKARAAGATAGALVDVQVGSLNSLPFGVDAFDAVLVHTGDDSIPVLGDAAGVALLREGYRVLRSGGRILVVEGGPRGVSGLLRSHRPLPEQSSIVTALASAGFRAARPLAEREGYRFTEGLK